MLRTIWQEIQTIAVALLVAALIWLFAESENVKDRLATIDIQLVAPPGQTLVINPSLSRAVKISFKGSTAQLQEINSVAKPALLLQVEPDPTKPLQQIDLKRLLRSYPAFAAKAIHVTDVEPQFTDAVDIETKVSRTLPVVPRLGDIELAGPAAPGITQASLYIRAALVPLLEDGTLELAADVKTALALEADQTGHKRDLPDNVPQRIDNVPLRLVKRKAISEDQARTRLEPMGVSLDAALADASKTVNPPATTVTFTPLHQRIKSDPTPVTILLYISPIDARNVVVEISGSTVIPGVVFEGPREQIDKINKGTALVRARLELTGDDILARRTSKAVVFDLPRELSDVVVVQPSPPPTVSFTITPRAPGPP